MITGDSYEPQTDGSWPRTSVAQSKFGRFLWNVVGSFFLVLGLIGIPLPLVPTTPFLVIAAACYLRGSGRMASWMMMNRYFGSYLRDYLEGKGLPIRTKVLVISMLWGGIGISATFFISSTIIQIVMLAFALGVTIHLLLLKTKRRTYETA
jgi:uncharacterized membrane protein YbaN (DUF454 family)